MESRNEITQYPRLHVENTVALIKPDANHKADEIEAIILKSGFTILKKRTLQLSPEQCSDFYEDQYGKPFFPSLTAFMCSGPIIALLLTRDNAIDHWKAIIGPANIIEARKTHPECLRAKYGTSDLWNGLHGSDSISAAEREIKYLFEKSLQPVPTKQPHKEYLNKFVVPTLVRGLTEVCRKKPLNPKIWLSDWLIQNNPLKDEEPTVEEPED